MARPDRTWLKRLLAGVVCTGLAAFAIAALTMNAHNPNPAAVFWLSVLLIGSVLVPTIYVLKRLDVVNLCRDFATSLQPGAGDIELGEINSGFSSESNDQASGATPRRNSPHTVEREERPPARGFGTILALASKKRKVPVTKSVPVGDWQAMRKSQNANLAARSAMPDPSTGRKLSIIPEEIENSEAAHTSGTSEDSESHAVPGPSSVQISDETTTEKCSQCGR